MKFIHSSLNHSTKLPFLFLQSLLQAMAYSNVSLLSNISTFWSALFYILASFACLLKSIYCPTNKKFQKNKLPPGPKPWPIIGNLPEMLANMPASRWIHNLMNERNTEIMCVRLGDVHVIAVTCPVIAREFLIKQDAAFASRPISMSTNLVTSGYLTTALVPYGEQWKKMKKILSKEILSPIRHQWLHDKRIEEADNLVSYVYNSCKNPQQGGLVNVRIAARHYCGNVIRKLIFNKRYFGMGRKDGGPGFEEASHVDALFSVLKYIYAFSVSDYIPCLREFDLDGHKEELKKALKILNKYHDPIIEDRIQQWKNGLKEDHEDLLDVLITLKDANGNTLLTAEEIRAQIRELMIEVVDNPSNAVEWAIAEMINQPELLQRAIEELDNVVGRERQVQESDLPKLNYVKACAKEAFRLHPIVPFNLPHVSMNDTVVANYFIPKGSHVLLSRLGLGRNPEVWDEPLKFKPERHLKSDGSEVVLTEPNLRFITFTTGRRSCPGIVFGTSITVMLLARLLHGFTWTVPPRVSSINLEDSGNDLFLAEPLVVMAKPRLAKKLYFSN